MNEIYQSIKHLIKDSNLEELYSLGIIDEIGLRNLMIKSGYQELRKSISISDSIFALADEFNLSPDRIHSILFRKRHNKSMNILSKFY